MKKSSLLALFLFCPMALVGQHPVSQHAEAGRALFQKKCASCHGENAKGGGRGPDLTTGSWRHGGSDEEIIRNITEGIPDTQMPPFPMPRDEAQVIVMFLRGGKAAEPVTGDSAAGEQLFFGTAQCSRCHMVAGRGGRLGPDLSKIRNERKPSELRKAIENPDETLRESFETLEVEFRDGKVLRGTARNQDTFSVQLMDQQERLHRLLKKDLKRVTRTQKSLMPVASLDAAQTDNLIAFLMNGPSSASNVSPTPWNPASDLNVSFARLKNARREPENWLTYWGDFEGTHYGRLDSITPANVKSLRSHWTFQYGGSNVEATPIVVDGVMFVTGPLNNAAALDARTGRPIWRYSRRLPDGVRSQCTVMTNRGFGILGDRLYMATLDMHLVALDAKTGNVIWDVTV